MNPRVRFVALFCCAFVHVSQGALAHDMHGAKAAGIDLTRLPLGDVRVGDAPRQGWIWACPRGPEPGPGTMRAGPWVNSDNTYDLTAKPVVQGSVSWPHRFSMRMEGDRRIFESNDLPNHPTGEFPIAPTDPASRWDRNPNRIAEQPMRVEIPLNPVLAPHPTCVPGSVGILLSGVALFSALDAAGLDAVAHEVQDTCQGHPQRSSTYHYHSVTTCMDDKVMANGHSELVGYAVDGFGIFGRRGEGGKPLTSADLDECHGHTHAIPWNGKTVVMYHYHGTWDFPYTIGCIRGTVRWENVRILGGGGKGPPGRVGRRPDLAHAAKVLGISEQQLVGALGPPPPNLPDAAARLGISVDDLTRALWAE